MRLNGITRKRENERGKKREQLKWRKTGSIGKTEIGRKRGKGRKKRRGKERTAEVKGINWGTEAETKGG